MTMTVTEFETAVRHLTERIYELRSAAYTASHTGMEASLARQAIEELTTSLE
jgi:hypothetical protein